MALKKCKECGLEVSDKAKTCPSCGVDKPAGGGIGCFWSVLVIGVFLWVVNIFFIPHKPQPQAQPEKPEAKPTLAETRNQSIEKCFSGWDGAHSNLVKIIKTSMNDPGSYEHVETRYIEDWNALLVTTTFRGKNKFGGVVKNIVRARTDAKTCEVLEILEQKTL